MSESHPNHVDIPRSLRYLYIRLDKSQSAVFVRDIALSLLLSEIHFYLRFFLTKVLTILEMTVELFYYAISPPARACELVLMLNKVDFKLTEVDLFKVISKKSLKSLLR